MAKRQYISYHFNYYVVITVLAGMAILATAGQPLHAQSGIVGPVDPSVSVDMSVLEDGGVGAISKLQGSFSISNYSSGFIGTLLPAQRAPVSRLHIRPQGTSATKTRVIRRSSPKLRRPKTTPQKIKKPIAPPLMAIKAPTTATVTPPFAPVKGLVTIAKPKPAPAPSRTPKSLNAKLAKTAPLPPPAVVNAIPKAEQTLEAQLAQKPRQLASIPPKGGNIKTGRAIRVVFNPGASKLPEAAKAVLKGVVDKLKVAIRGWGGTEIIYLLFKCNTKSLPSRVRDPASRSLDPGSRILDPRFRILDPASHIQRNKGVCSTQPKCLAKTN